MTKVIPGHALRVNPDLNRASQFHARAPQEGGASRAA